MNLRKKYSELIINYKCVIFFLFLIVNFFISGFLVSNELMGFSEGGNYDWVITNSKISEQNDVLRIANSETDELDKIQEIAERSRMSQTRTISFIYKWKDDRQEDIFNSKNLQTICNVEREVFKNELYKDYCYIKDKNCSKIDTSITNIFYPDKHNWDCKKLEDNYIENKKSFIYNNIKSNELSPFGFFVDKNFLKNNEAYFTRSFINLGEPLKGFSSNTDRPEEQRVEYNKFYSNLENKYFDKFKIESTFFRSGYLDPIIFDDLKIQYYAWNFNALEFNRVVNGDMLWTLCSILFVSLWIRMHTGSCIISLFSMLQIVLSMPFAFFIYRCIFGITYFTQLHGCAIFLALGIGADDVFVFTDAWKQNKKLKNKSLVEKLEMTLGRTILAVFNTSFTTTVAFLATATSPAMPISTFGIYAALTIISNYIFVILFTPSVIIINDQYFSKCCNKEVQDVNETSVDNVILEENDEDIDVSELGFVYKLFKNYSSCMNFSISKIKIFPLFLVITLLGYGIFNLIQASQLSPPVEQEKWFHEDHMFTGFVDSMTNDFKTNDINQYSEITVTWGIDRIDRSEYNLYRPNDYRGKVIFDNNFDATTIKSLNHIENACKLINNWECNLEGCSGYKGKLAIPNTTICFIDDYKTFFGKDYNRDTFLQNLSYFRSNTIPLNSKIKNWKNYIGFVNGKLKYVTVSFRSTVKTLLPMKIKEPVYTNTENMIIEVNKNTPNELGNAFQDAGITWVWYDIERNLISSMFNGLAICFPVSFLVLLFATRNWYLSLLSISSIGLVVSNVLGFCKFIMGWDLGIAETVSAVIVIGFSIDYTLHIGHMYEEAREKGFNKREERIKYSLERMGTTVLAGAITTAGSALFMLMCQMTFFYKMALLISVTILNSLVYSLLFLVSLCILIGPENEFGQISLNCLRCKSQTD